MKRDYIITYYFTSTRADGDGYSRSIRLTLKQAPSDTLCRIEGFRAFGARFNDNCYDWQAKPAA